MKTPVWLEPVLSSFEDSATPFMEVSISEAVNNAAKGQSDLSDEDRVVAHAEWAAFGFYERPNKDSVWGTYFAPMMTATRKEGTEFRSPDLADLNEAIVGHWEDRARAVKNPVMRARYADVVWDLKKAITKERPSHEFAQIAIDSYLESAQRRMYSMDIEAVGWLRRALDIALSLRDKNRTDRVVKGILDFYDAVVDPKFAGVWIFPFDALYGSKDLLTPEQEGKIIADLESMLAITTGRDKPEDVDPHGAQAAAERLAQHYKRLGDTANVRRVITSYGEAFSMISKGASPILAMAWLQPVIERYQQEGLKEEAERLQMFASEKAKDIASDMKTVSVPVEINQEEVKNYIEQITSGDVSEALHRIAAYFIPKVEESRAMLERMRHATPLLAMIPLTRVDAEGRPLARIGSIDDDPDGRLHEQLGQALAFQQPFLVMAFDRLRERYNASVDDVLAVLNESPLFQAAGNELLLEGLTAHWDGDYVKAIHVLVPQVEHTLRSLLALLGVPTVKTVARHPGILDAKSMNDALEDERVRKALTEDLWRYLVVLYIDRKGGLNLRNDLAHGLAKKNTFNRAIADRVIHSLLTLSLLRSAEAQNL